MSLLTAIKTKQIAGTDLTADLVQQLQFLKSDQLNGLLTAFWGTARETAADKLTMIADYKALVASGSHPEPDLELGLFDVAAKPPEDLIAFFSVEPDDPGGE